MKLSFFKYGLTMQRLMQGLSVLEACMDETNRSLDECFLIEGFPEGASTQIMCAGMVDGLVRHVYVNVKMHGKYGIYIIDITHDTTRIRPISAVKYDSIRLECGSVVFLCEFGGITDVFACEDLVCKGAYGVTCHRLNSVASVYVVKYVDGKSEAVIAVASMREVRKVSSSEFEGTFLGMVEDVIDSGKCSEIALSDIVDVIHAVNKDLGEI